MVRKLRTCNAQPARTCFAPLCASHRLSVLLPDHYICPPPPLALTASLLSGSPSLPPLAHLGEIRPHQCVIRCETRDANGDMLSSYIGRGSHCHATVCMWLAAVSISIDYIFLRDTITYRSGSVNPFPLGEIYEGSVGIGVTRFTQPLTVFFPA